MLGWQLHFPRSKVNLIVDAFRINSPHNVAPTIYSENGEQTFPVLFWNFETQWPLAHVEKVEEKQIEKVEHTVWWETADDVLFKALHKFGSKKGHYTPEHMKFFTIFFFEKCINFIEQSNNSHVGLAVCVRGRNIMKFSSTQFTFKSTLRTGYPVQQNTTLYGWICHYSQGKLFSGQFMFKAEVAIHSAFSVFLGKDNA